jgi:hypothetical protein
MSSNDGAGLQAWVELMSSFRGAHAAMLTWDARAFPIEDGRKEALTRMNVILEEARRIQACAPHCVARDLLIEYIALLNHQYGQLLKAPQQPPVPHHDHATLRERVMSMSEEDVRQLPDRDAAQVRELRQTLAFPPAMK